MVIVCCCNYLVGGWAYHSEKCKFVNWDDEIPNWMDKYNMFQSPPTRNDWIERQKSGIYRWLFCCRPPLFFFGHWRIIPLHPSVLNNPILGLISLSPIEPRTELHELRSQPLAIGHIWTMIPNMWINYTNSLTWIRATWGWCPLSTNDSGEVAVRSL